MMQQLTFLGTSSGMPTKYRNVSGLAIEMVNPYLSGSKKNSKFNRPWVLIDCGEGTQHQLLHTKLSLHQLTTICITHVHGDHCYGLAGLLSSMAMSGRKNPLTLIAPKAISKLLDTLTITTELFFAYPIEFIAIEDLLSHNNQGNGSHCLKFSHIHQLDIQITPLSHRVPSYAYSFTQTIHKHNLDTVKLQHHGISPGPIWGKLQALQDVELDNGQLIHANDFVHSQIETVKVVVAGDNDTPELLSDAVKNANLLVHESTYTQAVLDKIHRRNQNINPADDDDSHTVPIDPQHSTAKQVAQFAQRHDIKHFILTHFSARYQVFDDITETVANMAHIRQEVEAFYTGKHQQNFWLANDFDCFQVAESVLKL